MAVDHYRNIGFMLPSKVVARVDKLALEFAFSRGKTLEHLVQLALDVYEEPIEKSNANIKGGITNKDKVAAILNNSARKLL